MKTRKLLISLMATILIASSIILLAYEVKGQTTQQQPKEHIYTVQIPEHLVQAYYNTLNKNTKQVSVDDYFEMMGIINNQLAYQQFQYRKQDSLAAVKPHIDTSSHRK